ncbi:MAG: bifunctional phosphopantothenoylcysteine decarboxylase/phosphopantothenate--cysteine ligase CoaBC [Spirochaetes bacterium]|nr:bifunctional phosphopantothenoylcysteine decarboxylase/phosphopantothenate--cysteine ligase CoaBC [Spirochaetota bacterium]
MVSKNINKKSNVLIGVTAGIAVYKTLSLVRLFKKAGADVRVVMTENSKAFVAPLSFEAVSGNPVYDNMFARRESFPHISMKDWADIMIVAPATANFIGKLSAGIADDLLSTSALSFNKIRILCPAMNVDMWNSAPVKRNIEQVELDGWTIAGPDNGSLACGDTGMGRMLEPEDIFNQCMNLINSSKNKKIKKIVITAGATRQPIDAVRFISNPSTGKMGLSIAAEAEKYFEEVVVIHGYISEKKESGIRYVEAMTAQEMLAAIQKELNNTDVLVMSAAVSDYFYENPEMNKIKKADSDEINLKLSRTPDILKETINQRKSVFTVGFAMETTDLEKNAKKKLEEKKLDMILANPLDEEGAGFASDTNRVVVLKKDGNKEDWEKQPKESIARKLIAQIITDYDK